MIFLIVCPTIKINKWKIDMKEKPMKIIQEYITGD